MQIAYSANLDSSVFGLPGNYFSDTMVNPVKAQLVALTDLMGRRGRLSRSYR